jgi:hypothetical protein
MHRYFTPVFLALWVACAAAWLAGSAAAGALLFMLTFSPLLIALLLVVFAS